MINGPRAHALFLAILLSVGVGLLAPASTHAQEGDAATLTIMLSSNDGLRAQGMDYIVQQIDYFRRDGSRASARLYAKDFGWIPGDARRNADGANLGILFDEANGSTGNLAAKAIGQAVDRARQTWAAALCLDATPLVRSDHPGGDVTVFDGLLGDGTIGDPFGSDIVVAGFVPGLDTIFGPDTLAFSVTFIFVDGNGVPTDMDGDGRLDTAHNEIYFNPAFDWTLDTEAAGTDIETTALHELGHSLGLGHIGTPPEGVMNPVYGGVRRELYPIDHAAICVLY
jgi:hypothetical protein